MFKFSFNNLGPIKDGNITLAPFTIICGRNNVGKTYISHAIYACLLEAKKNITSLNHSEVQYALKADKEIKLDIDIQTTDIRKLIPSQKDIQNEVNSTLSKGGLAKFFSSNSTFNELKIEFEFNIDIEKLIYEKNIDEQHNIGPHNITFHKSINSYELTTTYRKKENSVDGGLGHAFLRLLLVKEIINTLINIDPYIATSERTGIALFQPAFDAFNNQLNKDTYEIKIKKSRESIKHIENSILKLNDFPQPIIDNLEFIRLRDTQNSIDQLKNTSALDKQLSKLIGGNFSEKSNSIEFKPLDSNVTIPFSMASSSSKSIFLIEKFIKRKAKPGSILIIDEPELNLHIDNQLEMANLLATLVNSGVQVIITTHSDHMLREINVLMMLGSKEADTDEKMDILKEYNIDESSILDPAMVKAYVVSAKEGKVFDVKKTKFGLNLDLFNDEIITNNRKIRNIQESLFN